MIHSLRWLRRAAWLLLVLILLGVLAWTGANLGASWRYQSALAELEAEGFATDPYRIAPAAVSPIENAAPFYSAAFALYAEPESEAGWEGKKVGDLDPQDRAAVQAWLERNVDALDMVRRAQKRSRCRFEHDYSMGYSMLLPEVTPILGLSRAFGTLAETQLLAGNGAAARESVKLIFALGDCLREDPILISQLVRLTTVQKAVAVIDGAVTGATGEAELREWQALLPPDSVFTGSLERAYRGEIAMTAGMLAQPSQEASQVLGGAASPALWALMRPLIRYDGADFLRDMRQIVLASRKPYLEATAELATFDAIERKSFWRPLRSYVMPGLGKSLAREAVVAARLIVLRAGLEAELAHRTSGAYPKVVSGTDPFSGKPLIYDLEQGRIASVRPTRDDDQDRPVEWRLRGKK